jgi:hypothetical protein
MQVLREGASVTHCQRVLDLLSDGKPHSHLEVYDLRVVAHSRVAALRAAGHLIDCWKADGVYWYRLLDGGGGSPLPLVAPAVEQPDQLVIA